MGLLTFISLFREEHRRRKQSCPFFSASAPALTNRTGSRSQSTKPPSKSKPPTRSTSKSKYQDIILPTKTHDGDPDDHSDSSRSAKVRSRSKSVTRSEPEGSNAEGEIKKKTLRSKSKTKAEDSEDVPRDVPRKSSRFKAKASKGHEVPPKPSRTRSKTKVFESEPEEEPLTTIKPRSTSQAGARREVRIPTVSRVREIDVVGNIEPEPETNNHVHPAPSTSQRSLPQILPKKVITSPPNAATTVELEPERLQESEPVVAPIASAVLRHQSQTAANLFSNDTVIENHIPPPSSPSPTRQEMNVVEISSDEEPEQVTRPGVVGNIEPEPETNNHGYPAPSTSQRFLTQTPLVLPAFSKPNNQLPSVPIVSSIREIDVVGDIEPEPETKNHVYPAPSTSQRSLAQTPPKKVLSKLLVQPNNPLPSVPAVSPIREIDVVADIPEPETKNHVYPAPSTSQRSLAQTPPKKVLSTLLDQPNNPLPSIPAVSPIREIDVVADLAPESGTNNHVDTAPSTPQRSLPRTPSKVIASPLKAVPSTTVELIPALSKLPSIPLHTLTEAELDMTVEEWIRYQMDVEYDKFRRDGERELQRFRNQAEEVRKTIEGL